MAIKLYQGDSLEVLKQIPENSIDSIVTDPPAAIHFMNKSWDGNKGGRAQWIAWLASILSESMRTLKPGGHSLVWALPRMSHWTMMAIEDVEFEIRDVITHLFAQGMPKSMDIAKAIDKATGVEGSYGEIKSEQHAAWVKRGHVISEGSNQGWDRPWMDDPKAVENNARKYVAGSETARQWTGWGTALKPGAEYWILARKPLAEKTLTANIIEYGAGALNIEECRIPTTDNLNGGAYSGGKRNYLPGDTRSSTGAGAFGEDGRLNPEDFVQPTGRWPSNVILSHGDDCDDDKCQDGCPIAMLDEQTGNLKSGVAVQRNGGGQKIGTGRAYQGSKGLTRPDVGYDDTGGASRFYYCPKAAKKDRGSGNIHPTVKNTNLMEYLIRLITPAGGVVLDPFMGSGSTGVAAVRGGWGFIGIELSTEYFEIAQRRIEEK